MPPPVVATEQPVITFQASKAVAPCAARRGSIPTLRLRILVADDNRDAADTLGGLLLLCGADVRVCYGGVEADGVADEFRPDVGLFDVHMPGVDGCELARRVREGAGPRPLLLIAITGVSDPGAVRRTARAGFNVHLTKPADLAALLNTLADFQNWLASRSESPDRPG